METPKRLTDFMNAALEDAFDKLKSVKQMERLKFLIDQKMFELITIRENSHRESPTKREEEEQELEDLIEKWKEDNK